GGNLVQLGRNVSGHPTDVAVIHAGLDVVVESDVAALHADGAGAGEPGEVGAGAADLDALHVCYGLQRLGRGNVVVVDRDAAADVDDSRRLLELRQGALRLGQRLFNRRGHAARVRGPERHGIGEVEQ